MFDSVLKTPMMFVSSVIRQKGKSQNGSNKKIKPNFPKKRNISYSLIHTHSYAYLKTVCVYGGKKCSFFRKNFGVLCFLVTFVLRFVFLPYYRRANYLSRVRIKTLSLLCNWNRCLAIGKRP